ncbi:MAG: hypothetical protein PHI06_12340 [Desulfobulbaceae bacterium]|nr:hypothetical protein [Desulfobulbaceae bacterium]
MVKKICTALVMGSIVMTSSLVAAESQPIVCFRSAVDSLKMSKFEAIKLCSGSKNGDSLPTECFKLAVNSSSEGGLGLPKGEALELCKAR